MKFIHVTVKFTRQEAIAALAEIEGATTNTETSNPGPYHPQHHDAKRAAKKIQAAIVEATKT